MGLGSALGSIGKAFSPRPGATSYRTPPFVPPGMTDEEAAELEASGGGGASDPPPAPESVARSIGSPEMKAPPTYRPELDQDTQKYLDVARKGAPMHPQHGTLRTIGESLAGNFMGRDLATKIFDRGYSRDASQYQHELENAALPAAIRAKADKNTADVSHTMASGALTGKQAENYDSTSVLGAVERGGELQPDNPQPPADGQPAKPREGSNLTVAGKKLFFPSKGQQAREAADARTEATQSTYRPLPKEVTESLGLPADFKVPPGEVDSYVRIFENKAKKQGLHFESHVDETTGNVTTVGRDAATGKEIFKDTIPGIAKKRPQVTSFNNSPDGEAILDRVAQSLANGDLSRLRDIASLRGDQRLRIYDKAKQINPNFSTADIDRQIKMEDYYTNGKGAASLQSFGTFLEHAGAASEAINGIRNTNARILNKPLNWLRSNVGGDPQLQSLLVALEPVRKEFEGFLLGGRALYAEDRKQAEIILNENSSPAQVQAALTQMGHTAEARLNEENHRYKKVRGRDLVDPIGPDAIEGGRRIGLKFGDSAPSAPKQNAAGGAAKPIVQKSPSTGAFRYSTDGGKTWHPGQPPSQ